MTTLRPESYQPVAANRAVYDELYALYRELHDSFGGLTKSADLSHVMKSLLDIKYAQRA
jgi:L-ribulokinase